MQVLNQDETPLLYSLVFGEGVVNDATSVVLFNAIENLDIEHFDALVLLNFIGKFMYLFVTSTALGVAVSILTTPLVTSYIMGPHAVENVCSLKSILMIRACLFLLTRFNHFWQTGLLSAYVIKKLGFARSVQIIPVPLGILFLYLLIKRYSNLINACIWWCVDIQLIEKLLLWFSWHTSPTCCLW